MKITTQIIKDLNPCEDRRDNFLGYYPLFSGDHEDFLLLDKITHKDKLWVILRLMDRIDVEVFAIDCAVYANTAYAAYASYAAYTVADAAANAADAAYAAAAAYYAADAADYAAASAAASAAAFVNYEASGGAACERERQVEVIIYLINRSEGKHES